MFRYVTGTPRSRAVPVFWDRCYHIKLAPVSIIMWQLRKAAQTVIHRLCVSHNTHTQTQREWERNTHKTQAESKRIWPHWPEFKNQSSFTRLVLCLCADMLQSSHLEQCGHNTHTLHQQDQPANPPI